MVEWADVVTFLKDWSLVVATVGLVGVTAVLVWVTWRLGNITRETGEKANALAVKPFLVFEPVTLYYEGEARIPTYSFTVDNNGNGDAINPTVKAMVGNSEIPVTIRPELESIPANQSITTRRPLEFYISKSHVTDDLRIEIECHDIEVRKVKPFVRIYTKNSLP